MNYNPKMYNLHFYFTKKNPAIVIAGQEYEVLKELTFKPTAFIKILFIKMNK